MVDIFTRCAIGFRAACLDSLAASFLLLDLVSKVTHFFTIRASVALATTCHRIELSHIAKVTL